MVDPLLERPLEMRHALRTTPESHLLAEIVPPFSANRALAARNADFKRNSVANSEAIDLRTNAHNYTGGFMAKRQRGTSAKVAIREFFVVTDV